MNCPPSSANSYHPSLPPTFDVRCALMSFTGSPAEDAENERALQREEGEGEGSQGGWMLH